MQHEKTTESNQDTEPENVRCVYLLLAGTSRGDMKNQPSNSAKSLLFNYFDFKKRCPSYMPRRVKVLLRDGIFAPDGIPRLKLNISALNSSDGGTSSTSDTHEEQEREAGSLRDRAPGSVPLQQCTQYTLETHSPSPAHNHHYMPSSASSSSSLSSMSSSSSYRSCKSFETLRARISNLDSFVRELHDRSKRALDDVLEVLKTDRKY